VLNRALVLGGGGVTGVAWLYGLLAGLAEFGLDLAGADAVIGTSAGAVVGAALASGAEPEALYRSQLDPAPDQAAPALTSLNTIRWAWTMVTTRDPVRYRVRIGRLALTARTMPEADRRKMNEARLPSHDWPAAPLKITAVDADSGEFVVFDAAGAASLVDAVTASTAAPGAFPPATIEGRRFMDGGVRSPANADLASGSGRVLILAPVALGSSRIPGPYQQAAELRAAGAEAVVVKPDDAARRAIGRRVFDPSRCAAVARAGRAQAAAAAAEVQAVWSD
jgi:NTE family protein